MHRKVANPDRITGHLAGRQHGVVSLAQLLDAGVTEEEVRWRLRTGRFYKLYRGVYSVGHPPVSRRSHWMGATLALGPAALLSQESAAVLFELLPDRGGYPHVTVPSSNGRLKRAGLVVHRSLTLTASDSMRRHGIPVTGVSRTIEDLRRTQPVGTVRRAIRQAEFLGLALRPEIERDGTRSPVERRFLDLLREHRIPVPEVNTKVGRARPDFLWRAQRFAIEAGGWAAHRGAEQFEDDHRRELELAQHGIEVLHLTERQLEANPAGIAAFLRERLSR